MLAVFNELGVHCAVYGKYYIDSNVTYLDAGETSSPEFVDRNWRLEFKKWYKNQLEANAVVIRLVEF